MSKDTVRVFLSHDLFFTFENDRLVCWNYRTNEQFELTLRYFHRLREIGTGTETYRGNTVDKELLDGGLICTQPGRPTTWKWSRIAHIFHVGTQNISPFSETPTASSGAEGYRGYLDYCNSIVADAPPVVAKRDGISISLPRPEIAKLKDHPLWQSLLERKTSRDFTPERIDLSIVSTILYAVFGAVHNTTPDELEKFGLLSYGYHRTSASAGGLQSVEPFLLNFTIDGLDPGTFHYHSIEHRLYPVAPTEAFSPENLGPLLAQQNFAAGLAFGVFLVVRFDKLWWKYPYSRAYRAGLLDAGHLSQTFQLVCTALSLKTWLTGYFHEDEINKRLGLDPECESCVLLVGAGFGSGEPIPKEMQALVAARRQHA